MSEENGLAKIASVRGTPSFARGGVVPSQGVGVTPPSKMASYPSPPRFILTFVVKFSSVFNIEFYTDYDSLFRGLYKV